MRIDIWADVVCPWSYIGKRRLERALAISGEPAEVVWRPFRIDPMAPAQAEPLTTAVEDPVAAEALRRCTPDLSARDQRARLREAAAAEGLGPPWGAVWRADSGPAHRLIALAAHEPGGAAVQNRVVERVMEAHFVRARDISASDVLQRVARDAAFPRGGELLAGDSGKEAVRELLLRGKAIGVRTSPTLVVNGQALAGAQPARAVADFLRAAGEHSPSRLPEEAERFRHAQSLLDLGDPLGALTMLRPLVNAHGTERGIRLLAARAYFHSAQLGRAQKLLEPLAADSPDDSYVQLLLGRVLQRRGREEEAAPYLRIAAAMTPTYG